MRAPKQPFWQLAPRALDQAEQRAFVRAVERCPVARDRAIATVFLQTGLRLSELSALKLDAVSISARRGQLRVRSGKGDRYREVPLNSVARVALSEWLRERGDSTQRRRLSDDEFPGSARRSAN